MVTAIIIIILSAILITKIANVAIELHFRNEQLKIEREYQEERAKQNQAFLDYLKHLSEMYSEHILGQ